MAAEQSIIAAAGGIIYDENRRLLLVKRGRPPGAGLWSVPGGKCEPGEDQERACIREVGEETGLLVSVSQLAGRIRRDAPDGAVFDIADYLCDRRGGDLRAGDDAAEVGWFSRAELLKLPLVDGLLDTLRDWEQLPD